MNLLNLILQYFEGMIGQEFHTLVRSSPFQIVRVGSETSRQRAEWLMVLRLRTGNQISVYVSDILRIYVRVINDNDWVTQNEIANLGGISIKSHHSYLMPLVATFDEIAVRQEGEAALRYIPDVN